MKFLSQIFILFVVGIGFSQESISDVLRKYNANNIPYMSVHELSMPKTKAVILDSRELKEYEISHLKDAIFVGFNDFNVETVLEKVQNKNEQIIVYCSVGIRSETIAEKIKKAGYTNVFNLYGGIFEWKNEKFPIYNSEGLETEEVHVFSKEWSIWLKNGIKIYE